MEIQVFRREVGKCGGTVGQAMGAPHGQPDRARFHGHGVPPASQARSQEGLGLGRFRRRQVAITMRLTGLHSQAADDGAPAADRLQKLGGQMGNGGLAVCACRAEQGQVPRGMTIDFRGQLGEGLPSFPHEKYPVGPAGRETGPPIVGRSLAEKERRRSRRHRTFGEPVAVVTCPLEREKRSGGIHTPRIGLHRAQVELRLGQRIGQYSGLEGDLIEAHGRKWIDKTRRDSYLESSIQHTFWGVAKR